MAQNGPALCALTRAGTGVHHRGMATNVFHRIVESIFGAGPPNGSAQQIAEESGVSRRTAFRALAGEPMSTRSAVRLRDWIGEYGAAIKLSSLIVPKEADLAMLIAGGTDDEYEVYE